MAFDYKKEYKEFYMPKNKPGIIEIPKMNYIAVQGKGNPNEENGEYKNSIGLLYGIAFTIKMSYKGTHKIEGFFEYVVPPLEGLWWQENTQGLDYARDEPVTVDLMHDYMKANGYEQDITDTRYHHEIYLSDPRKCDVSRLKTVVRHPIRKAE